MTGLLIALHVFLVIILIVIILVQQPRGGGLGAFFGGGAQDLLGVRGAPTFFQKLTWGIGAGIGALAILIALISKTPKVQRPVQGNVTYQILPLFSQETQEESLSLTPVQEDTVKKEKTQKK